MSAWVRLMGVRFAAFGLTFSVFPAVGMAWLILCRSSRLEIFCGALRADPRFATLVFASALAASCLWALILAAGSTWVWRDSTSIPWIRIIRVVACFYLAGSCIYPALWGEVPVIGAVPLIGILGLLGVGIAVLFVLPRWWCGIREFVYIVFACALFYCDPRTPVDRDSFARIAGRRLNEKDVIILGFDSVRFADAEDVLLRFTAPGAQKFVFSHASTPVASTAAAWRTVLSGVLPEKGLLPGEMTVRQHASWLPFLLNQQGYETCLQQDNPSTNIYATTEQVHLPNEQGWRWILKTMTWRIMFPLSEIGGDWWVNSLGGEANSATRLGYSPLRFQDNVLRNIATAAARGPILYACHSCLGHPPIHLTFGEVVQLDRWWLEPPRNFWGGLSLTSDIQGGAIYRKVAGVRANTVRQILEATLNRHAAAGVIGNASVFVLSDHGPRVSWLSLPEVHHVMLTVFRPGSGAPSVISEAVSLADIAPTIREVLNLPGKEDEDGKSLFLRCNRDRRKMVAPRGSDVEMPSPLEGAKLPSFAAELVYEPDGTYRVGNEMRKQIQRAMANESTVMESLKYLLEKGVEERTSQPPSKAPSETAELDGPETASAPSSPDGIK